MIALNMHIQIDPQFSADDWQLLTRSMDCSKVAEKLNHELKIIVNGNNARSIVEKHMHQWMAKFAEYGANDTEPIWFLEQVIDEIYGNQNAFSDKLLSR